MSLISWEAATNRPAGHLVGKLPNGSVVLFVDPLEGKTKLWRVYGYLRYKDAKHEDHITVERACRAGERMTQAWLDDLGLVLA